MLRRHWCLAPILGIAVMAWTCAAQEPEKPSGSSVGEKVDRAVQSLKKSAREAGEAVREQYHKMRTAVHDMGVSGRIYGRLHWDKSLTTAKLDVDVKQDGQATLTGTVPTLAAKAKAVELTRDTVGVTGVVDRLTVSPDTDPAKTTTTPKTP